MKRLFPVCFLFFICLIPYCQEAPTITSIDPGSGSRLTSVTITGSGFAQEGNKIVFQSDSGGDVWISKTSANSSNGTTLMFDIPVTLFPLCYYESIPPCISSQSLTFDGRYLIYVEIGSMRSNSVGFVITGDPTPEPSASTPRPTDTPLPNPYTLEVIKEGFGVPEMARPPEGALTVTIDPPGDTYPYPVTLAYDGATTVILQAHNYTGTDGYTYTFNHWSIGSTSAGRANPGSLVLDGYKNVTAVYLYPGISPAPSNPATCNVTVWLEPQDSTVGMGSNFGVQIHVNSGYQRLAAYGFTLTWSGCISVNTSVGTSGVEAGQDGYVSAVRVQSSQIIISGFDTAGTGPGSDLNVVTINFTAGNNECSTNLDLTVANLVDETTSDIPANPMGGSVSVTGANKGDVNDDGSVGIVDALLVAQYYVGMSVSINTGGADVDCNGSINIVDALQIAQYYVGRISSFPC